MERDISDDNCNIKIGLDSGKSFLKCTLTIFPKQDNEESVSSKKDYLDTSHRHVLILACVQDMSETYKNIEMLMNLN